MSRIEKRILFGLALLLVLITAMEAAIPKPVDWTRSWSRNTTKPYATKLVYERLADLFPEVRTVDQPVAQALATRHANDAMQRPVNHAFVNAHFGLDVGSCEMLLDLVAAGDHLLIAAEEIHGHLSDTLGFAMRANKSFLATDTTRLRFIGPDRIAEGAFAFARGYPDAYFSRYDEQRSRVLAVNGSSEPVVLEMTWGQGRIVLCSAPLAFTNHNLLKGRNAVFMAGVLSLLPERPLHWDEHYKVGRAEVTTPLRFILGEEALRWAWYTILVMLLVFLVVRSRREQRAIPVVAPPRNATRALLHTIGRLYWHKADHADLARRMIAHFKEDMRIRTYMRAFTWDKETTRHLAAKSGLDDDEMAARLAHIQRRETAPRISEEDLLKLSDELHELRQKI